MIEARAIPGNIIDQILGSAKTLYWKAKST